MITIVRSSKGSNDNMKNLLASQHSLPPVTVYIAEELGALGALLDFSDKFVVRISSLREDIDLLISQKKINLVFYGVLPDHIISKLKDLSGESPVYSFIVSGIDEQLPDNKLTVEEHVNLEHFGGISDM